MAARLLSLNESPVDRLLRAIVGAVVLSVVFVGPRTPWGWLGLVLLLTAFVGSCPLYTVLGISTKHPRAPR